MKIQLKDDVAPYCVSAPCKIALPLLRSIEEELARMEESGIIEKITKPTEWCAPIVPVHKRNGKIRICVDLTNLNKAVKRERLMLPTLEDIVPKLKGTKIFSKLDATNGFWQLSLHPNSAKYTTFITQFGRYCFCHLPFRISSGS